jgi:phage I-like protein
MFYPNYPMLGIMWVAGLNNIYLDPSHAEYQHQNLISACKRANCHSMWCATSYPIQIPCEEVLTKFGWKKIRGLTKRPNWVHQGKTKITVWEYKL